MIVASYHSIIIIVRLCVEYWSMQAQTAVTYILLCIIVVHLIIVVRAECRILAQGARMGEGHLPTLLPPFTTRI